MKMLNNASGQRRFHASEGAQNLLQNGLGASAGEQLLLVDEYKGAGYYHDDSAELVYAQALNMGLRVKRRTLTKAELNSDELPSFPEVSKVDHALFMSRVGDQLRFAHALDCPSIAMCYVLDPAQFASAFANTNQGGLVTIKNAVEASLSQANNIEITCPLGSKLTGRWRQRKGVHQDVAIKRFPMQIIKPVDNMGFSGHLVLSKFLVGTGAHFYDPYCVRLSGQVIAEVQGNELVAFHGDNATVRRIHEHYQRLGDRYNINPVFVHSWHAGIHPACAFSGSAVAQPERWSGSAFGNPRILHFHTCGDFAPGEVSWTLCDASVNVDGQLLWQAGQLNIEALAAAPSLTRDYPELVSAYASPAMEIGL